MFLKKFLFRLILSIAIFMLSSCSVHNPDYLFYQKYPFTVKANIIVDSFECTITANLEGKNSGNITYHSPETLKDIVFSSDSDGVYISYEDLIIPVSPRSDADFLIFLSLFSLDEAQFSGAELGSESSNVAHFKTDAGNISVNINAISGLPEKISAELYGHSIEMKITDFEYGDKESIQ